MCTFRNRERCTASCVHREGSPVFCVLSLLRRAQVRHIDLLRLFRSIRWEGICFLLVPLLACLRPPEEVGNGMALVCMCSRGFIQLATASNTITGGSTSVLKQTEQGGREWKGFTCPESQGILCLRVPLRTAPQGPVGYFVGPLLWAPI